MKITEEQAYLNNCISVYLYIYILIVYLQVQPRLMKTHVVLLVNFGD